MKPAGPSGEMVEKTLQEMVRRIVDAEQPERIILFGSWATGRARPDSDVDLLVIVRNGDAHAIAVRLYRLLAGIGVPKDLVVVETRDFDRLKDVPGTVVRTAVGRAGFCMRVPPEVREVVRGWVAKAEHDL